MPRVLVPLLCLAACSSDPDIKGIFQTDLHSRDPVACSDGAPLAGPAYFMIRKEKFLFLEWLALSDCDTPDGVGCTLAGASFTEVQGDGWRGWSSAATGGSSGTCSLSYVEDTSVWQADGTMRVDMFHYAETPSLPTDQCTSDEAKARGTSMPCVEHELYVGPRIGDAPPAQ